MNNNDSVPTSPLKERSPSSSPSGAAKGLPIATGIALVTGIVIVGILNGLLPIVSWLIGYAKLAFYALTLSGFFILAARKQIQNQINRMPKKTTARAFVYGATFVSALAILFAANIALDSSDGVSFDAVVADKSATRRKGSTLYELSVPTPEQFKEDPIDHINLRTNVRDYEKVIVGSTVATVKVHSGFLLIPWVQSYKLQFSTAKSTADKTAAENWRVENAEEEAQITWKKDFWPNGQLYGDIPFKDGKKHGQFKLFRENGTLDQELSFKDGRPHGIARWYDESGHLKQQETYIDGELAR